MSLLGLRCVEFGTLEACVYPVPCEIGGYEVDRFKL